MMENESLLQEYEDLFTIKFYDLKGIKGHLGEVKIEWKLDAYPMKHRPY